ncbi:hypothetical protein BJ878DRAFT_560153, partial [Calycina marina]
LPIGTLPVYMVAELKYEVPGLFLEKSEGRQKFMVVYNRYFYSLGAVAAKAKEIQKREQEYDAIDRILFEIGYMLNHFAFEWRLEEVNHPMGAASVEDANIAGATVLVFAAIGKAALAFAHQLKHGRPDDTKPQIVVAVGSNASSPFTENTYRCGRVLECDYDIKTGKSLSMDLGVSVEDEIILVDFRARDGAVQRWLKIPKGNKNALLVGVAGGVVPETSQQALGKFMATAQSGIIDARVNVSDLSDAGIRMIRNTEYFEGAARD